MQFARESAGTKYQPSRVFRGDGFRNFGKMLRFNVICVDFGAGFYCRHSSDSVGCANVEDGEMNGTAIGHEELTHFIELIRGPASLIAGGDAAMHATH